MSKALRVVVPPHPLIGHWLTLLRDRQTPPALFATAMGELGRWLTYEALRDWIPYQRVAVDTPMARTEGTVVDASVPLLAVPLLSAGLGLWEGARTVLPHAALSPVALEQRSDGAIVVPFNALPEVIPERAGVLVFAPQVASAARLLHLLELLETRGVEGVRVRVITTVAASPGLKRLGERFGELTLYTGCIDAELDDAGQILPGVGDPEGRLCGLSGPTFVG